MSQSNVFHDWLDAYLVKTGLDLDQLISGFFSEDRVSVVDVIEGIKAMHPAKQSAIWKKFIAIDKSGGDAVPYFRYLIDEVELPATV